MVMVNLNQSLRDAVGEFTKGAAGNHSNLSVSLKQAPAFDRQIANYFRIGDNTPASGR
jgi:hypothetical protein